MCNYLLPVCTFFTMAGGDSKFARFTVPSLKAFLNACSQNVSDKSKILLLVLQDAPKKYFSHSLAVFW